MDMFKNTIIIFMALLLGCDGPGITGAKALPALDRDDIIWEYAVTDSLNRLVFSREIDGADLPRLVVLGPDERNQRVLVRRCEDRFSGCKLTHNVSGLFYEDCISTDCGDIGGVPVIDYVGIVGTPRYTGCEPDTS